MATGPYFDQQVDIIKASLIGATVIGIRLGQYVIDVEYASGTLQLESGWKLCDTHGKMIDFGSLNEARTEFGLWRLVGARVINVEVSVKSPTELIVTHDCGIVLTAYGDHDGYDDWSWATRLGLKLGGVPHVIVCNEVI